MKDEEYLFRTDIRDKAATARSARYARTHCGKGGSVKLPSDYLTKKELKAMNGEVKSYRLNDPMSWEEFKAMPDDVKVMYIKAIRRQWNTPGKYIAEMLGTNNSYYSKEINRLGISEGMNCRGRCTPWDRDGFYGWWHGVDALSKPVSEEPDEDHTLKDKETVVADELPSEEPDPLPFEPDPLPFDFAPLTAIPCNGSMNFNCPANQALNMLAQVLGDAKVSISVMWRVIEEGGIGNG